MDVDVKGKRLFVAGLENGSLEVVDLQAACTAPPASLSWPRCSQAAALIHRSLQGTLRSDGFLFCDSHYAFHGFNTCTRVSAKSLTLRETSVRLW